MIAAGENILTAEIDSTGKSVSIAGISLTESTIKISSFSSASNDSISAIASGENILTAEIDSTGKSVSTVGIGSTKSTTDISRSSSPISTVAKTAGVSVESATNPIGRSASLSVTGAVIASASVNSPIGEITGGVVVAKYSLSVVGITFISAVAASGTSAWMIVSVEGLKLGTSNNKTSSTTSSCNVADSIFTAARLDLTASGASLESSTSAPELGASNSTGLGLNIQGSITLNTVWATSCGCSSISNTKSPMWIASPFFKIHG